MRRGWGNLGRGNNLFRAILQMRPWRRQVSLSTYIYIYIYVNLGGGNPGGALAGVTTNG